MKKVYMPTENAEKICNGEISFLFLSIFSNYKVGDEIYIVGINDRKEPIQSIFDGKVFLLTNKVDNAVGLQLGYAAYSIKRLSEKETGQ